MKTSMMKSALLAAAAALSLAARATYDDAYISTADDSVRRVQTARGFVYIFSNPNAGNFDTTFVQDVTVGQILVVGGGGGGGGTIGGGGGGGQVIDVKESIPFSAGSKVAAQIGRGGNGSSGWGQGTDGGSTTLSFGDRSYTATGGGAGGGWNAQSGKNGACGGGSSRNGTGVVAGTGTYGYGGGLSIGDLTSSGGGGMGGAGGQGVNGQAGEGGIGIASDILGLEDDYYGGGGGGGAGNVTEVPGNGGLGGGGDGAHKGNGTYTEPGHPGENGRGGGGGGGGFAPSSAGGNGGSGSVMILVELDFLRKFGTTANIGADEASAIVQGYAATRYLAPGDSVEMSAVDYTVDDVTIPLYGYVLSTGSEYGTWQSVVTNVGASALNFAQGNDGLCHEVKWLWMLDHTVYSFRRASFTPSTLTVDVAVSAWADGAERGEIALQVFEDEECQNLAQEIPLRVDAPAGAYRFEVPLDYDEIPRTFYVRPKLSNAGGYVYGESVACIESDIGEDSDIVAAVAAACARASGGEENVVLKVGPGTYTVSQTVRITAPITVIGVEGAENTILTAGAENVRLCEITSSGAVLSGFTVTGGRWVGGDNVGIKVNAQSIVEHCVISNNFSRYAAGVYLSNGGIVRDSTIADNGVADDTLYQMRGSGFGSGVWIHGNPLGGRVERCLIVGCRSYVHPGAAVTLRYNGVVDHCTIVNTDSEGAAVLVEYASSTISNSIVWNSRREGIWNKGTAENVVHCCAPELKESEGHVWADPMFTDPVHGDYTLKDGSPCINSAFGDGYLGCFAPSAGYQGSVPDAPETLEYTVQDGDDLYSVVMSARRASDRQGESATIDVGPGTYVLTDQLLLDGPITLRGAGAGQSILQVSCRYTGRCLSLTHPDAVATGFSLLGGRSQGNSTAYPSFVHYGLGAYIEAGTLSDCLIEDFAGGGQNSIVWGGGVYAKGGRVERVVIRNNEEVADGAFAGSGMNGYGAFLEGSAVMAHCVVSNLTGGTQYRSNGGIGVWIQGNAHLENSLIARNRSAYAGGGGVYMNNGAGAVVKYCTIVDNETGVEGGGGLRQTRGLVDSCIIFGNKTAGTANEVEQNSATIGRTMSSTFLTGEGNIQADDAGFVNAEGGDYHLALGSLAIDATGITSSDDTDLDGNPRVRDGSGTGNPIADMGCFEFRLGGEGLLALFNVEGSTTGYGSLSASFTSSVLMDGESVPVEDVTYTWNFGDGTELSGKGAEFANPTHVYTSLVRANVTLVVEYEGQTTEPFVREGCVSVYDSKIYVSPTGGNVFPFNTPETAIPGIIEARNAMMMALAGGAEATDIYLLAGEHPLPATLSLDGAIRVHGLTSDPSDTVIVSAKSINPVLMTSDGAMLDSLTLKGGDVKSGSSAGIYMTADGVITNCVITECQGAGHGNSCSCQAVYMTAGLVVDTEITGNPKATDVYSYAGGAALRIAGSAVADRCIVARNHGGSSNYPGTGVRVEGNAILRNSLVAFNVSGGPNGAGVALSSSSARVENCTVVSNLVTGAAQNYVSPAGTALPVGGVYIQAGTVVNSIVWGNWSLTETDTPQDIGGASTTWEATSVSHSLAKELTVGVNGNIASDPQFKDFGNGDFCLRSGSPAINAGVNLDWALNPGTLDLNHKPRKCGALDIGCYEVSPGFAIIVR